MDQVVAQALTLCEKLLQRPRPSSQLPRAARAGSLDVTATS
jgi:hypothetical protein